MNRPTGRTLRLGVASAALLGLSAVTLTGLASSALFTDTKSTSAAALTTGNVALNLGGTASTAFAVTAMAPGAACGAGRYRSRAPHPCGE